MDRIPMDRNITSQLGTATAPQAYMFKTSRSKSLVPESKLIQISRNLGNRVREVRNELAKEIADAQAAQSEAQRLSQLSASTLVEDENEDFTGPADVLVEAETAEERMRSTYWGLELLAKTGSIDPSTPIYVIWLGFVALAFAYNMWTITLRESFPQYAGGAALTYWLIVDYICDAIYIFDMVIVKTRILYHNDDGLMVYDRPSTRRHYLKSREFKIDMVTMAPLDIFYAVPQVGVRPLLRSFRLLKVRSFWEFFDRVSTLLASPDIVKVFKIMVYIILTVHIFTCCYYAFSVHIGVGSDGFAYEGEQTWPHVYARCFYIAFKIATSINSDKTLSSTEERAFMILAWLVATFVVVVLLAQIRETFYEFTREDDEFSRMVHTAQSYLRRYNCPVELESKVQSWFMYTRSTQRVLNIQKELAFLPKHIQTSLALEINYKTLRKVSLFANCDRTILTDIVVKLKPVLYLPGDFICKKGEIGKEMYIIVKGEAEVVSPDFTKIFVTLTSGAVFGEISLLAVGGANRRTANVRSKGFSNMFILSKDDFEEIMQQYPLIYARLKKRAAETLAKSNAPPPPPPQPAQQTKQAAAADASGSNAADAIEKTNNEKKLATDINAGLTLPRPRTPKLLQLIRAVLPQMPSLRRLFRVQPIASPDPYSYLHGQHRDSIDPELADLEWSTPSPDNFYIPTEAEEKLWEAATEVVANTDSSNSNVSKKQQGNNDKGKRRTSSSTSECGDASTLRNIASSEASGIVAVASSVSVTTTATTAGDKSKSSSRTEYKTSPRKQSAVVTPAAVAVVDEGKGDSSTNQSTATAAVVVVEQSPASSKAKGATSTM